MRVQNIEAMATRRMRQQIQGQTARKGRSCEAIDCRVEFWSVSARTRQAAWIDTQGSGMVARVADQIGHIGRGSRQVLGTEKSVVKGDTDQARARHQLTV